jgi:glutamate--cysteine ligase
MSKITEILSQKINANYALIENWFEEKFTKTSPLFYNSTDLRHNGIKITPVDTNCFPAGFNNLSEFSHKKAKDITDEFLEKYFPDAKKILIIPENHTRNLRYLESVRNLQHLLNSREVVVGSISEEIKETVKIDLENGHFLELHSLKKESNNLLTAEGFTPDLIILNNDLTDGIPEILKNLTTPIIPSPEMGWHRRTKSDHFTIYNKLAEELSNLIDLDPWLISSMHRSCHEVNFKEQIGTQDLANYVDELIKEIAKKYQQYGIDEAPYCYMKADNGTYGMAVLPVFSGADILEINKKERNKMSTLKGSVQISSIIIQEGIRTIDTISDKIAEPMIYLIGGKIVGNLFRANENRTKETSLNAAGASFFDLTDLEESQIKLGSDKNNIKQIYSLIARLAALAAAQENTNL